MSDEWKPSCYGRDFSEVQLLLGPCGECRFREGCSFFTDERRFKCQE